MPSLESFAGSPLKLALTLDDGAVDKFPQATIFNGGAGGSPTPITTVDLDHKALGLYRDDWNGGAPGEYFAVYIVYDDAGHTIEANYVRAMDSIIIRPYDKPHMGVAYDDVADNLLFEAFLSKAGQQVLTAELGTATLSVFDADDNLLFPAITDLAADSEGVFRLTQAAPGLTADRLYNVKIAITTTTGTVMGQQGFMVTK